MLLKHSSVILMQCDKRDKDGVLVGSSLLKPSVRNKDTLIVNSAWQKMQRFNHETKQYETYEGRPQIFQKIAYMGDETRGYWVENLPDTDAKIKDEDLFFSQGGKYLYLDLPGLQLVKHVAKKRPRPESITMSVRTRSKIKDKCTAWYQSLLARAGGNANKVMLRMFTLTLTEIFHDQQAVNNLLNLFFTKMRKLYGRFSYLWVAELQDGKRNKHQHSTGNIHYHVLFDRYFNVQVINGIWLSCLQHLGLKTKTADGKRNLQPVDVATFDQPGKLQKYLTKYVTKNDSPLSVQIWNCSRSISALAVGIYRTMSFDALAVIYPLFDGVFTVINDFVSVHRIDRPPRSYLANLLPIYQYNSQVLNFTIKTKNEASEYLRTV